ncbi:peptidyl-prolyl cis-trans isomerase [Pseudorhodoplanes sp.]|uniref:peptidyl-prolyl cis-trans isomerase n=1 Tax=Pseudorhodoplanes sp. TaxID=1934341 RepID=UPI002BD91698|nr:peptidyl-prolyl cis-trans isomerase [Pseudorhodoplanes sp.]HWV53607.1 peptidyl-prolyl cis-trans isomerase [Pseudorhodoplanes sp.]
MLRGIQNATRNWLGRLITGIVLGMIAISFAVWGIADIFRGFGTSTVAKVGSTEIGVERFRQNYNEQMQRLIRQVGKPIPADQARALGLHRQMLGQMIAEAALDENIRQLGLNLPDDIVAQRIRNDPTFRGISGQFDRNRFNAILRELGYTEARYVAERRKQMLQQEIIGSLAGEMSVPEIAIDAQNRFANELRALDYLVLGPDQAGEIKDPTPEEIAKFFEERKGLFRAPEFRKVDLVTLSADTLAKTITISDEDARKAYDADRAKFVTPERRAVHQIVFPTEAEAREALEKIKQPDMGFEKYAASPERKGSDVNLGMVPKSQILDPAVADAAFALQPDSTSEPIKGRFGFVLLHVGKVEPETVRPFEEVAAELKNDLAMTRARSEVRTLYDKLEDERGAGGTLAELAKKVGLSVQTIDAIDRSGRGPDGKPVSQLPDTANLFSAIFNAEVGTENDPIQIAKGDGYLWFEVVSTTPSRERPLDEVRDRVIERWRNDQIAAKLKELATQTAEKLKTTPISDVAAAVGTKPQFVVALRRDRTQGDFPANALDAVFQTPKDGVGTSQGASANEWVVFRVTGVTVPALDPNSADAKRIRDGLTNMLREDVLAQYLANLQATLGATINEAALNQVIGGSTN